MPRVRKKKSVEDQTSELIAKLQYTLQHGPMIWLPAVPENADEVKHLNAEVYYGVADVFQVLVLRYESEGVELFEGNVTFDASTLDGQVATVSLSAVRSKEVFTEAKRQANLPNADLN